MMYIHPSNFHVEVLNPKVTMTHAQRIFEATMRAKGHTDFAKNAKGKYTNNALQIRWNYFQLGWEMREVTA